MALISCPECRNNVSSLANTCPNCGVNIQDIITQKAVTVSPKDTKRTSLLIGVFIIIGVSFVMVFGENKITSTQNISVSANPNLPDSLDSRKPQPVGPTLSDQQIKEKIDPNVFAHYTRKDYPDVVKKFKTRLEDIEIFRQGAALAAVKSTKCDHAKQSDLALDSSTLSSIRIFVNCENGEQIFFNENELKDGASIVKTQKEKAWTESIAKKTCEEMIREKTRYPSKTKIHSLIGTSTSTSSTGNVGVNMEFEAMNDFGAMIPQKAVCIFSAGKSSGEITFLER